MKKTMLWMAVLMTALVSCDKKEIEDLPNDESGIVTPADTTGTEVTPGTNEALMFFVGRYDLDVAVLADAGEGGIGGDAEHYTGSLEIALPKADDPQFVTVQGYFNLGGGDPRLIYNTTGTLDADGNLVLETSEYVVSVPLTITYDPIQPYQPLVWNSAITGSVAGYNIVYDIVNTATRMEN